MEATNLADLYGSPLLEWDRLTERLTERLDRGVTQAPETGGPNRHTCWLATINPDGNPHVTGIGATWVDGTFWFETGDATRKGKNLARSALFVEPREVTDRATVARMAERWAANGWPARVDETGLALTADYSAPSAGPPPWFVYRLEPKTATAIGTVDPGGATRWRF